MSRHKFKGEVTLEGVSASTGNALVVTNSTPVTQLTVANQGRVTLSQDLSAPTQTNGTAVIRVGTTNSSLVLSPNGTGAIMAQIPDGTATGGNARGSNAVDLQMVRTINTQIASGTTSVIGGGTGNSNSGTNSVIAGGSANTIDQGSSVISGGSLNEVRATRGTISGGDANYISGAYSSIQGGQYGRTTLYGQRANAAGQFAAIGDAQTSAITYRRVITGTAQTELFLDGASLRAILNIASPGPTNARAWRAQIDLVAIVQTAGTGTLVLGETFIGSYFVGIKRIGATTSLIGSGATAAFEEWDTNMATSVVTITADVGNNALKIEFTPPTGGTSSATSVIRVVATAYLTEVGY